MVALYTEGFCITNICFSLDIYVKLIKSLPNQATQLTASPPPLGTEKDRKSKSSSFLSSVPKYKYRVLLFYLYHLGLIAMTPDENTKLPTSIGFL